MNRRLFLFRSVRFNVGLVLVLVVSTAIGTLLPQLPETPEKAELFMRTHAFWGRFFKALGLFDLYHSWWFLGLLALLAFDIVVCKLWSRPPDAGLVNLPPEMDLAARHKRLSDLERSIPQKPLHASLATSAAAPEVLAAARDLLTRRGYQVEGGEGEPLVATRHRVQRWGSYVAHVALVVILTGGLVKQFFGFAEMVPVLEGASMPVQNKPGWELAVDKFTIDYYEGTQTPKLFASEVRVLDGDRTLASKRITVNDPLSVGAVRFYQATWGAGGMFRTVTLDLGGFPLVLKQRAPTPLPGTRILVTADMLLPNFTVASDGRADTESLDLKNPAVKVHFQLDERRTRALWLLLHSPDTAFTEDQDGVLRHAPSPPMRLASIDPKLFSGIQVGYDPGFPLVAVGSVGWLVGNVLLFYLHRRRVWVLASADGGGARLLAGAWSSRGAPGYKREFDALISDLKHRLEGHVLTFDFSEKSQMSRRDPPMEAVT